MYLPICCVIQVSTSILFKFSLLLHVFSMYMYLYIHLSIMIVNLVQHQFFIYERLSFKLFSQTYKLKRNNLQLYVYVASYMLHLFANLLRLNVHVHIHVYNCRVYSNFVFVSVCFMLGKPCTAHFVLIELKCV